MLTVKDYLEYKKTFTTELQTKCDEWLKEEIFPNFTSNGFGVEKPSWVSIKDLKDLLNQRGWAVETLTNHQGSFLYLSIPPQGE